MKVNCLPRMRWACLATFFPLWLPPLLWPGAHKLGAKGCVTVISTATGSGVVHRFRYMSAGRSRPSICTSFVARTLAAVTKTVRHLTITSCRRYNSALLQHRRWSPNASIASSQKGHFDGTTRSPVGLAINKHSYQRSKMWYRTDKKNKIRKNGDTRGYLFFYRTFFIVIIYTVDWRADLRTHRSKVNAGTIAGPTLCLSIAKQGSPNETDASFRTNDPASTSLSPSSQGADFPPTTSLEARGGKTQKKWEPKKRYRPWWEDCREVSGKQSNICLFLSCPCSCRTKNEQKGNNSKKKGGGCYFKNSSAYLWHQKSSLYFIAWSQGYFKCEFGNVFSDAPEHHGYFSMMHSF